MEHPRALRPSQERRQMASLHHNAAGTWLLRFRFDGRQYYRSLNTTSEAAASNEAPRLSPRPLCQSENGGDVPLIVKPAMVSS